MVGYARVSTSDQDVALQLDALRGAGVERIVKDVGSGSLKHRPQLDECLERLRAGGCGPNPRAAQRQAAGRRVGSQSAPLPERLHTTAAFQLSRPSAGPGCVAHSYVVIVGAARGGDAGRGWRRGYGSVRDDLRYGSAGIEPTIL